MILTLLPIDVDEKLNSRFKKNPDCIHVLNVFPDYYKRVGFVKPWIGYFAELENDVVGYGGFKGQPRDGKIEIAYSTVKQHEGKGVATEICRQLVSLALETDPSIKITARTLLELNASTQVLKNNGFKSVGIFKDEEDGDVWEWEFNRDIK
jgi:RimJ/RimL family protein N-acetyltransferase